MRHMVYEDHQTNDYDIFTLFDGEEARELDCCTIGIFRGQDQVHEIVGSLIETLSDQKAARVLKTRLNSCVYVHEC